MTVSIHPYLRLYKCKEVCQLLHHVTYTKEPSKSRTFRYKTLQYNEPTRAVKLVCLTKLQKHTISCLITFTVEDNPFFHIENTIILPSLLLQFIIQVPQHFLTQTFKIFLCLRFCFEMVLLYLLKHR